MRVSISENFKIWRWIGFLFFRIKKSSGGEGRCSLGLLAHYVATPPDRLDVVLAARCTSEFFSELAYKNVDYLHLWLVPTAVEIAQEHFLSQRRSLAQRQEFQHLVLFARKMHARTVDLDCLTIEIDT